MREKGFSTILGLCLILVIALIVKGIQAAETNHAYESSDFQTEIELQNAAESSIIAAVEEVRLAHKNGVKLLKKNPTPSGANSRQKNQYEFDKITKSPNAKNLGTITVRTWGERITIYPYKVEYNDSDNATLSTATTKNVAKKRKKGNKEISYDGYFFFSVAQATSSHTGGTVYRRASGYVILNNADTDNETIDNTIHFMEVPMSTYKFEK